MLTLTNFFRWGTRFFLPNAIFTLFVVYLVLTYQQATAERGLSSPTSSPLVTSTFAYQGFLTNASGQPINGNRALTFRLYGVPTGGTAIWTEVRNIVSIQNGLFDVRLGELIPIPSSVWNTTNLYLGIQVETEAELLPREAIGLVPVAQRAITADTATNATQADLALNVPNGSITSDKLSPTSASITLQDSINLTEAPQTIFTTTINVDYPARLLFIPTLDIVVNNGTAIGEVFVDNQMQTSSLHLWLLTNQSLRSTVSNSYLVNVAPGTHTISVTGRHTPGTTSASVQAQQSTLTYLILSQ